MSIPQTPSPLSNILASKTYNAAWFSGATVESQITAAIAAAVTDSALYVFVPANMLPYTAGLVTFNTAVKVVREGLPLDYYSSAVPNGAISGGIGFSINYDPPSLADGVGTTTSNIFCTGARLGDYVIPSFSLDLQGIILTAWVGSADTVLFRFQNESGGVLDLASGVLRALVIKA